MKADSAFLKYRLHFQLAASEIHLVSGIGEWKPIQDIFWNSLTVISKANPAGLFLSLIKVCFYPLHMTSSSPVLTLDDVTSFIGQPSILVSQDLVSVPLDRLNFASRQCPHCGPIMRRGLSLVVWRMGRSLTAAPTWCPRLLKMHVTISCSLRDRQSWGI